MSHSLHFPILEELGLTETEAVVYELLLEIGQKRASDLVKPSGIGRGNVYNVLTQLEQKGLVLSIQGKQTKFQAVDPSKLRGLLDLKLKEAKRLEAAFAETLPQLTSAFSLSTGKPAIQIFEGIDGARTALYESLQSKTEILTYFDVSALVGPMAEINKGYLKQRVAKQIPKRLIVADTQEARDFFAKQNTPFTKVAFLKNYPERHATAMELYDNTVSFLTLDVQKCIAVIIKDAHIYAMHKQQFDYLWSQAVEIIDYAAKREDAAPTAGSNTT